MKHNERVHLLTRCLRLEAQLTALRKERRVLRRLIKQMLKIQQSEQSHGT